MFLKYQKYLYTRIDLIVLIDFKNQFNSEARIVYRELSSMEICVAPISNRREGKFFRLEERLHRNNNRVQSKWTSKECTCYRIEESSEGRKLGRSLSSNKISTVNLFPPPFEGE